MISSFLVPPDSYPISSLPKTTQSPRRLARGTRVNLQLSSIQLVTRRPAHLPRSSQPPTWVIRRPGPIRQSAHRHQHHPIAVTLPPPSNYNHLIINHSYARRRRSATTFPDNTAANRVTPIDTTPADTLEARRHQRPDPGFIINRGHPTRVIAPDWIPSRDIREATGLRPEGPFQWGSSHCLPRVPNKDHVLGVRGARRAPFRAPRRTRAFTPPRQLLASAHGKPHTPRTDGLIA